MQFLNAVLNQRRTDSSIDDPEDEDETHSLTNNDVQQKTGKIESNTLVAAGPSSVSKSSRRKRKYDELELKMLQAIEEDTETDANDPHLNLFKSLLPNVRKFNSE